MYLYARRKQRRWPVFVGLVLLVCVAIVLLGIAWSRAPAELLAALNLGRTPTATPVTETATPTLDPDRSATPTVHPSHTPRPTETQAPSPTLVPTATPIAAFNHFLLARPVPASAVGRVADWTYLYGSTQHGLEAVHHGEEFVNPIGTPLLAAGDGVVAVAGNDAEPLCGDAGNRVCGESPNFYGNLVVLRLDRQFNGQPIFVLYGHMKAIAVRVGQHLQAGDQIGVVGDTGVAEGPHVHLEVRLGVNDYANTRNPVLWLRPLPGTGSIAGIVQDRAGQPLRGINVFLYKDNAEQEYVQDTQTYLHDAYPPVNSDDTLAENWAMGDLPAGRYLVRANIAGLNYLRHVTIADGQLTFVVFGGP